MSSIQSVAGQPLAAPLSIPRHHGTPPSATIWSERAISSSQVVGTLYPLAAKALGLYQTRLLSAAL